MNKTTNKYNLKRLGIIIVIILITTIHTSAQEVFIASGAGYKKPVTQVVSDFEKASGIKVNAVFGNMNAVITQAKQTDEISCIIGDKKFLAKLKGVLQFSSYQPIGNGYLVLAWRKGVDIKKLEDIQTNKITSVFMPDSKKAIYGFAASEYIKKDNLHAVLDGKLTQVATVPQVVTYLLTGEADAGFINMTEALANKNRLGGFIAVPADKYSEIIIAAGVVEGFQDKPTTKEFLKYLASDEAKAAFAKFGMK